MIHAQSEITPGDYFLCRHRQSNEYSNEQEEKRKSNEYLYPLINFSTAVWDVIFALFQFDSEKLDGSSRVEVKVCKLWRVFARVLKIVDENSQFISHTFIIRFSIRTGFALKVLLKGLKWVQLRGKWCFRCEENTEDIMKSELETWNRICIVEG